jgi:hypothetical protein
MLKYIPLLFFCFLQNSYAQSISERRVDSSGNILFITKPDTIATGEKYCIVEGVVLHSKNCFYYGFGFYFISSATFYMTKQNKIQIRFSDGEVFEQNVYTDGEFIGEGSELKIKLQVSDVLLRQMKHQSVSSVAFIASSFKHVLPITEMYQEKLMKLSSFLLDIDECQEHLNNKSGTK